MTYDRRASLEKADTLDVEEALGSISDDARLLKSFAAKYRLVAPIYGKLSKALQAPELGLYANRMEKRAKEIDQVLVLFKSMVDAIKKADAGYDKVMANPQPELSDGALLSILRQMPGHDAMFELAEKLESFFNVWSNEDSDTSYILSYPEEYIGDQTGVSKKLEKAALPTSIFDDTSLINSAFGFLRFIEDVPGLRERWE